MPQAKRYFVFFLFLILLFCLMKEAALAVLGGMVEVLFQFIERTGIEVVYPLVEAAYQLVEILFLSAGTDDIDCGNDESDDIVGFLRMQQFLESHTTCLAP